MVKLVNGLDRSRVQPSICSCWPADGLQDLLQSDVRQDYLQVFLADLDKAKRFRQGQESRFTLS